MPRFFFDFRQARNLAVDDVGCEFETVEEAYLDAVRAAQEMWRELLAHRENPLLCSFEVRDERGNDLFSLPFAEVLESCMGPVANKTIGRSGDLPSRVERRRREGERALLGVTVMLREAERTLNETMVVLLAKRKRSV